jgi:hypothetical protein
MTEYCVRCNAEIPRPLAVGIPVDELFNQVEEEAWEEYELIYSPETLARMKEEAAEYRDRLNAEEACKSLYCSFCGNTGISLVQGPSVYICEDCVGKSIALFARGKTVMVKGDIE